MGSTPDPSKGLSLYGIRGDDCDCGILHLEPVEILNWIRRHARDLVWDGTDRRGTVPVRRRLDSDTGNAIDGDTALGNDVALSRQLHPRWRDRLRQPDTDAGYRYLRRWAHDRAGRLERVFDDHVGEDGGLHDAPIVYELRRHRDVGIQAARARKYRWRGPRFSPAMLTREGRARWETERMLDRAQQRRRRGQTRRRELPHAAPHIRLMGDNARRLSKGATGSARPRLAHHDDAVRPPRTRAPSDGGQSS